MRDTLGVLQHQAGVGPFAQVGAAGTKKPARGRPLRLADNGLSAGWRQD